MEKRTFKMTRNPALLFAFLGCACCSTLLHSPQNAKIKSEIAQAEYLAGRGNYKESIALYEQTIKGSSKNPWRDRVLFNLGCLYSLGENPDKDFARSLFYLQRLKEEFPKSRFKAGIQVWAGLLENLVSLELELKASQAEFAENRFSMEQEIARLKAERLELESSWSTEIKLKDKKLRELETLIQTQKTAIEALQQQLKKMKEIDIQSEKKAKGIK
jgi:tetratricopeptide (TPR) repeat protein